MEVFIGGAGLVVGVFTALLAWFQWQRPRPAPRGGSEQMPRAEAMPQGVDPPNDLIPARVFCSRVPRVTRHFLGRDELVDELLAAGLAGGTRLVTQAIGGMGGVGKTTVAAAVAEAARSHFDIVWWVRAETHALLVRDLAQLAPHLGVRVLENPAETAAAVRGALAATQRSWLVVFDNTPDERSVEAWLPSHGSGAVLVTSRVSSFSLADEVVTVDTFSSEVAAAFLRRRVGVAHPAADEDLGPVVERLGGLPLALEQAGGWVAQVPNRRFSRFVELYDDASYDPFPDGTRPVGYEHTAATTWRVSVQAANERAPLAGRLLSLLAFFAPDDAPCQWLRDFAEDAYFGRARRWRFIGRGPTRWMTRHAIARPSALDSALDALHRYALVTISADDTVSVHRVVQAFARRTATRDAARDAAHAAVRCLSRQAPGSPEDHRSWPQLAAIAPHVTAVATTATGFPEAATDLGLLLNQVGTYQRLSGVVKEAIATATAAQQIAESHLGQQHPYTLTARLNLADAYRSAGDIDRAIPLLEAALADRERVLGPEHRATLVSRSHLALAYQAAGNLSGAVRLSKAAAADAERLLGADHPDTLTYRNNLAYAYLEAGDLSLAIDLLEANLADRELVLGPKHPHTVLGRANLALAYETAGSLERSTALYEAVLADREQLLGADHPSTLDSRHDLAYSYREAGNPGRAIPLFRATLADRERVLGAEHPDTLTSRHDLARTYQAVGNLASARDLFEATLADRERLLGAEHPDTLASQRDLASAYQRAGNLGRAVPLFERTFVAYERVMGAEHPATMATRLDLARARQQARYPAHGIPTFKSILADYERVMGAEHPDTLVARRSLAWALQEAGDLASATALFEKVLADQERLLGHQHPQTIQTRKNLESTKATGRDT